MLMWENWLKHSLNKKMKGQTTSVWYLVSCKTELLLVSYYLCKYMVFSPYLHARFYSYMKELLSSKPRLEPEDTCLWIHMAIRMRLSSFTAVVPYLHSHFMLPTKNKVYNTDWNQTCTSWSWSTLTIHLARLFLFQLLGMQKLKPGISSIPRQAPSPRRSLAAARISQSYQRPAVMKRGVFSPPFSLALHLTQCHKFRGWGMLL